MTDIIKAAQMLMREQVMKGRNMRTDRIATVCDAPDQHEYRIVGPDTPPHIAGTYDERTRTVVLGRLPEEPQHE